MARYAGFDSELFVGTQQTHYATIVIAGPTFLMTGAGNATFTVTAAGMTGSPIATDVALVIGDTTRDVARKAAVALNADVSTFIEDNIFGMKSDNLEDNINYLKYISYWSSPDNRADGTSNIELPWWLIYFYSPYRIILYAGDINFYHFFVSHQSVMNIDGNLREPLFYFEGDGIGLFGSAIRDTIYFNVTK